MTVRYGIWIRANLVSWLASFVVQPSNIPRGVRAKICHIKVLQSLNLGAGAYWVVMVCMIPSSATNSTSGEEQRKPRVLLSRFAIPEKRVRQVMERQFKRSHQGSFQSETGTISN